MTGEELETLLMRFGAPSLVAMAVLLQCDTVGTLRYTAGIKSTLLPEVCRR